MTPIRSGRIVVLVALVLALVACGGQVETTTPTTSAPTTPPTTVPPTTIPPTTVPPTTMPPMAEKPWADFGDIDGPWNATMFFPGEIREREFIFTSTCTGTACRIEGSIERLEETVELPVTFAAPMFTWNYKYEDVVEEGGVVNCRWDIDEVYDMWVSDTEVRDGVIVAVEAEGTITITVTVLAEHPDVECEFGQYVFDFTAVRS